MPPKRCVSCASTNLIVDQSAGVLICEDCGVVNEEDIIVAEVQFGETSGGAAIVQGSHVAAGATRAKFNVPWGQSGNTESLDQARNKARQILQGLRRRLGISQDIVDMAERSWFLLYTQGFTKGRKSLLVIGACCYAAIRFHRKPVMLIDLSDLLQANVFELGTVYLQLVQQLQLKDIQIIEPEFYIERFSKLLEFGEDREKIRDEAIRIVRRFKKDWLHTGRRPSGICGAALLLAARMNNYRRSVLEVVQVVKIADTTLKKRLEEFAKTPTASLSFEEFRSHWLEIEESNPPSFQRAREKELLIESKPGKENREVGRRRKRKRGELEDAESFADSSVAASPAPSTAATLRQGSEEAHPISSPPRQPILGEQSFMSIVDEVTREARNGDVASEHEEEPLFLPEEPPVKRAESTFPTLQTVEDPDRLIDDYIASEITAPLESERDDEVIADSLARAEELEEKRLEIMRRSAPAPEGGEDFEIDEAEIESYIMTEQEVELKERVWVELNRQYLEECAAKEAAAQGEGAPQPKKRKTNGKRGPRDSTNARGATPAESTYALLSGTYNRKGRANSHVPAKSKRINYEALTKLMDRTPKLGVLSPSQSKAGLRTPASNKGKLAALPPPPQVEEEEEEAEEMEVVEEEGPLPAYKALQGLHGASAYEESYEEQYDDSGWQEEV